MLQSHSSLLVSRTLQFRQLWLRHRQSDSHFAMFQFRSSFTYLLARVMNIVPIWLVLSYTMEFLVKLMTHLDRDDFGLSKSHYMIAVMHIKSFKNFSIMFGALADPYCLENMVSMLIFIKNKYRIHRDCDI